MQVAVLEAQAEGAEVKKKKKEVVPPEMSVLCLALPINAPVGCEWEEASAALRDAWGKSTDLANWGVTQLLKADPGRRLGDDKLRPMPPTNLYTLGIKQKRYPGWRDWAGIAGSAAAVLWRVTRKYLRERLAVQWSRSEKPTWYRYPMPWPVRAQEWKAYWDEQRRPCASVTLPGGRIDFRLRGGAEFGRQLGLFKKLIDGTAGRGELTICRQVCSEGCNRRTLTDREPGGGKTVHYREMVRIAVRLPKREKKDADGTLLLATNPDHFWVAQLDGRVERPWLLNADHVVQREAQHADFLQRISEDLKPEKRWPKKIRMQMNEKRAVRCSKHNRFIDTWTKQAASMVAAYCKRQGIGRVVYDDTSHSYCPGFAWHRQKTALTHRLEQDSIELTTLVKEAA